MSYLPRGSFVTGVFAHQAQRWVSFAAPWFSRNRFPIEEIGPSSAVDRSRLSDNASTTVAFHAEQFHLFVIFDVVDFFLESVSEPHDVISDLLPVRPLCLDEF